MSGATGATSRRQPHHRKEAKVKKLMLPLFAALGALLAVLGGSGPLWP
ncbi:MAG: hypothetical protein HY511_04410 [Actinobacteria bacterium]|nr:hypothetical protein [Actinomycetota bacterium]